MNHLPPPADKPRSAALSLFRSIAIASFAIVGAWSYWPVLQATWDAWSSNPDYSHGYLVVPIALWLLWSRRQGCPRVASPSWVGLGILLATGVAHYFAGRLYLPHLVSWTFPLWIAGVVWALFGRQWLCWASPGIAFLWFALPLPGTISQMLSLPLQKLAAECTAAVLRMIGHPAVAEGTTILLGEHLLEVERACSGLRMFYGITALAVAVILLRRPDRWKSAALLTAIIPVAVVTNVIRISVTGVLTYYSTDHATVRFSHDFSGLATLPLGVLLFVGLSWLIDRTRDSFQTDQRRAVVRLVGVVGSLLLMTGAFAFWHNTQAERAFASLLEAAQRAHDKEDYGTAVRYLDRYLRGHPDNEQALVQRAEIFAHTATGVSRKMRAASLLKDAWDYSPDRIDLAKQALKLAIESGEFREAQELLNELATSAQDHDLEDYLVETRAEILFGGMEAGIATSDTTWQSVADALQDSLSRPTYPVRHAAMLALTYRERLVGQTPQEYVASADALMHQLVEDHPTDPAAWMARYRYGDIYWREGTYDANADLTQAIELCGDEARADYIDIFLAAADRSRRQAELAAARDFTQHAIACNPRDSRGYAALAEICRELGNLTLAIDTLRAGIRATQQDNPSLRIQLASLLAKAKRDEEAQKHLDEIHRLVEELNERDHTQAQARVGIALVQSIRQEQKGELYRAIETMKSSLTSPDGELLRTRPNHHRTIAHHWFRLGRMYEQVGYFGEAAKAYHRAVNLVPRQIEWRHALATLALRRGDVDVAVQEFERLAELQPESGDVHIALASAKLQRQLQYPAEQRDLKTVRQSIKQARKLNASPTKVAMAIVDVKTAAGKTAKAIKMLESTLQDSPEHASLWRALAILSQQTGDSDRALSAAREFAARSDDVLAAAVVEADLLTASDRGDEAIQRLISARKELGNHRQVEATIAIADLTYRLGDWPESRSLLERLHEQNLKSIAPVNLLARLAWQQRDWTNLERYERWLQELEGAVGTRSRAYRVLRLLATDSADETLDEIATTSHEILKQRPLWPMSHFLQGQVALKQGDVALAIGSLEKAWNLGERGALVAEQLLSLYHQTGRDEAALEIVQRLDNLLPTSPSLFDQAIRHVVTGDQLDVALTQTKAWSDRDPEDALARVRLARMLLVIAQTVPNHESTDLLQQAETEFQKAIQLAPDNLTTWTSCFAFYLQTGNRLTEARNLIKRLNREANIKATDKEIALSRLCDIAEMPSATAIHLMRAIESARDPSTDSETAVSVLASAAERIAPYLPELAQDMCREALTIDANNRSVQQLLVSILASSPDQTVRQSALRQLKRWKDTSLSPTDRRIKVAILADEGKLDEAISLLRDNRDLDRDDRLLLARLYEVDDRPSSAFDLLNELAASDDPRPQDLKEFLRFWQEHLLPNGRLTDRAKQVYAKLGSLPGQRFERLRWEIRGQRHAVKLVADEQLQWSHVEHLLDPYWQAVRDANLKEQTSMFFGVILTLLQEGSSTCAIQLCQRPPEWIAPHEAVRQLAFALFGIQDGSAASKAAETFVFNYADKHADTIPLTRATADLAFFRGDHERAIEYYHRVLSIEPDNKSVLNNVATILSQDDKTRPEALQIVDRLLDSYPDDSDVLETKAVVLTRLGRMNEAKQILTELIARGSPDVEVFLHLSVVSHRQGHDETAREALITGLIAGLGDRFLAPSDRRALANLRNSLGI